MRCIDLPHSRCGKLVNERSKYDDRLDSLNCSVPAVSRLHVIASAISYPCAIASTLCKDLHLEYTLSALWRSGINNRSIINGELQVTHIYLNLLAIGVLDCRVVAFNPDILHELGCGMISD